MFLIIDLMDTLDLILNWIIFGLSLRRSQAGEGVGDDDAGDYDFNDGDDDFPKVCFPKCIF